jgi:putative PIN family toxin of toxin-antitoxin system
MKFKRTDAISELNKAHEMVRAVIDTNVLVSALIHDGKPRKLVLELLDKHTVVLSRQLLAEFADVIGRDKFPVKNTQAERFLSSLVKMTKIVPDNPLFKAVSEDPDDDVVLNTAYAGKADYIITGDRHLLTLNQFKKAKIVSVNQMLGILKMQ